MGSVTANFDVPPPAWAITTGAFQRHVHPAGASLDFAITANVIVDTSILAGETRPFDESLRYSGGEDLDLFQRLHRAGNRIVSHPAAHVHESIPESRVTKQWVVTRQFRRGTNRSAQLKKTNLRPLPVMKRLAAAASAVVSGSAQMFRGIVAGESSRLQGRARIAYGVGLVVGLTGRQHDEYRVTHGN